MDYYVLVWMHFYCQCGRVYVREVGLEVNNILHREAVAGQNQPCGWVGGVDVGKRERMKIGSTTHCHGKETRLYFNKD